MVDSGTATERQGISRRRVVQGAAWAVPAVMVASAAPALAASQGIITVDAKNSCKLPGQSYPMGNYGYYFTYCVNNPSDSLAMSGSVTWSNPLLPPQNFNVAAGGKQCFSGYVYSDNSANFTATATITYQLGTHPAVTDTQALSIGGFNPCCTGNAICPPGCSKDVCPPSGS